MSEEVCPETKTNTKNYYRQSHLELKTWPGTAQIQNNTERNSQVRQRGQRRVLSDISSGCHQRFRENLQETLGDLGSRQASLPRNHRRFWTGPKPIGTSQDSCVGRGSIQEWRVGGTTESSPTLGPHCLTTWPDCALGEDQTLGDASVHGAPSGHKMCSVPEGSFCLGLKEALTLCTLQVGAESHGCSDCSLRFGALAGSLGDITSWSGFVLGSSGKSQPS